VYNFIPTYGYGPSAQRQFMPYAFGGVALFGHNPKAAIPAGDPNFPRKDPNKGKPHSRDWVALRPLNTGGQGLPGNKDPYSFVSISMPVGLGVKYKLTESLNLNFEIGARFTYFDYIDDVGNDLYPDPTTLNSSNCPLASKMSYRADEKLDPLTGKDRTAEFTQRALALSNLSLTNTNEATQIFSNQTARGTKSKDTYILTQITINYTIGKNIKCPAIR
ncbi:MAG: hypothetical protein ACRCVT_10395, partial [Leadbetterella sp.]